jgi:hypothetical protein
MISDEVFEQMLSADPKETDPFISRFFVYIENSEYKEKLKLAIEKKDPSILLDLMYSLPKEKLDKELPYIVTTGRFIYLLRLWNK